MTVIDSKPQASPRPQSGNRIEASARKNDIQSQLRSLNYQRSLSTGDSGQDVKQAQHDLSDAGYPSGRIDGEYDDRVQDATQNFQQDRIDALQDAIDTGLSDEVRLILENKIEDIQIELDERILGPATQEQLENVEKNEDRLDAQPTEVGLGDSGSDVLVAQQALEDAGHPPGEINGEFDQSTLDAAQAYQQERIDALNEDLAKDTTGWARLGLRKQIDNLEAEMEQGVIGEETLSQLEAVEPRDTGPGENDLTLGSVGTDVVGLQQNLEKAGYLPGDDSGLYDINTADAVNQFQQDSIGELEQRLDGELPIPERIQVLRRLARLNDEQVRGVVGDETRAQLDQANEPDATANIPTPWPRRPVPPIIEPLPPIQSEPPLDQQPTPIEPNPTLPSESDVDPEVTDSDFDLDLEFPDVDGIITNINDGDLDTALEAGLNSDGDSIELNLGTTVKAPGRLIGFEGELTAEIHRIDDGYELTLGAEAAASIGIGPDANDLGVDGRLAAGAKVRFRFDSIDEVKGGVHDLVVSAGKNRQLQDVAELADNVTTAGNDVIDAAGDLIREAPGPLGALARRVLGSVDDIADRAISSLPDSIGLPIGPSINLSSLKEQLQELDDLRADFEDRVDDFADLQRDAQTRLDDAYDGFEVSGGIQVAADLGIPKPLELRNLGVGADVNAGLGVTAKIDADGNASVVYTYEAGASVEAGAGIVGGQIEGQNSISFTQEYRREGFWDFEESGDLEVEFKTDIEALARLGSGVTIDAGAGGTITFSSEAKDFGADLSQVVSEFLSGDVRGALSAIGDIDGDVTLQARTVAGAGFSIGGDLAGAELSAEGELQFIDRSNEIELADVSLDDAFEFLLEQVDDANNTARSIMT